MLWILVYFIILLCIMGFVDWCFKNKHFDKIPGPKGMLFVGNTLDFLSNKVCLFYRFRYFSNKYKTLFKFNMGPIKFVMIINPEDVETVISGSRNTKKGYLYRFLKPWLNDGLLVSYGEKWHQRRRILTPAFHFNVLQHYKKTFEENSLNLVRSLESELDNPEVNITDHVAQCTLNAICQSAMGVKLDEKSLAFGEKYKEGIKTFAVIMSYRVERIWLHVDQIFSLTRGKKKLDKLLDMLKEFRNSVISKRSEDVPSYIFNDSANEEYDEENVYKKKRLAMLDLLFQAEKEGQIDREGICEEVDTFMFEGYDTTATALQYIFMSLANHPEEQEKVVEELKQIFGSSDRSPTNEDLAQMKYLECCIKETLRLFPPVYFIIRSLEQDVKLKDHTLPAGTECAIIMYDLHRRPDQFVEPQQFRPERFAKEPTWHPYAYIPFSAGPRNCIGQRFAMMEMKIVVSDLLRRYKFLPVTKPKDLVHILDMILRNNKPIYVKVERR